MRQRIDKNGPREKSKPAALHFDCGVPFAKCRGAQKIVIGVSSGKIKVHDSQEQARKCSKDYWKERSKEDGTNYIPSKPQLLKGGKSGRIMVAKIRG